MSTGTVIVGHHAVFRSIEPQNTEGFVILDGREMYRIPAFDKLPPFLMTLVSDVDLWMYVSSRGGLTAGRASENRALFPYETDDKLHLCHGFTGPLTRLRVHRAQAAPALWQPFAEQAQGAIERNLYKSILGNRIIFEEINASLGVTFRYQWCATDAFGFVRTCTLLNHDQPSPVEVEILDGLVNLLPAGAELRLQQQSSCLINAYTRCEVDEATGLGIFALTSLISDRAEPAESLYANVAWCHGLESAKVLLSTDQMEAFRQGREIVPEKLLKGRRGAYLVCAKTRLDPGESRRWHVAADAHLDHGRLGTLLATIADRGSVESRLTHETEASEQSLLRLVASADGLQSSENRHICSSTGVVTGQ